MTTKARTVVDLSWKMMQSIRRKAAEEGEAIARTNRLTSPPVDPFKIIAAERRQILAKGDDFGNAFDGRLKYVGPRFLLSFNTKYNQWPHDGDHHPKVRFTIGHELGHYFLDSHRRYLVRQGGFHHSFTEFRSDPLVEQQADCFAAGLLMPKYLLAATINTEPQPNLELIRQIGRDYQVSLTSLLVRWVQLSDFPIAVVCVGAGRIAWGWVSDGFKSAGIYRVKKGQKVVSPDAVKFVSRDSSLATFRMGEGTGLAHRWLDYDGRSISVDEHYAAIPYTQSMLVLLVADEDDLPDRWDD